jgi:hypothetical protein
MTPNKTARLAGVLYLLSGLPGVFSYLYIPAKFVAPMDAAETARRIAAMPTMYRFGIVSDVFGQVMLIALAWTLARLLEDSDRSYARLMVALATAGAVLECVNALNLAAPLLLVSHRSALSALGDAQLDALALAALHVRAEGLLLAQVFWGLWLLPFGILVIKSGRFPRMLGWLLIVGCFGYVTASTQAVLAPTHGMAGQLAQAIGGLSELAIIVWLFARGAPAVT